MLNIGMCLNAKLIGNLNDIGLQQAVNYVFLLKH